MKHSLFLIFMIGILVLLPVFSQEEEIREEIKIDWWVLPLFAVDKDGNAVLDLKDSDIGLWVNNQKVTDFTLYKRSFSVATTAAESAEKDTPPLFQKSRSVFLLFDIAFTTRANNKQVREIAKKVVRDAEDNTRFTIIAVDPLIGPDYIGGPLTDKEQVVKLINEKVGWNPNTKSLGTIAKVAFGLKYIGKPHFRVEEDERTKFTPFEMAFLTEQRSSGFRQANKQYYRSFETLYHALRSIKDNKFIYLFSEGISLLARNVLTQGQEEYWSFMEQVAGYLSKSGSVLFIVNPAGDTLSSRSLQSGENSLRHLASESGGTYIEGEETQINRQIGNISRAYYEIAFPDVESFAGDVRHIAITAQRSEVKIHTLRSLEKKREYTEMNEIEKELLALNLLNPSPIFQSPLKVRPLLITKKSEKTDTVHYKIDLPPDFAKKSIEIFKIWLTEDTDETKVIKESLITKEKLNIVLNKQGGVSPALVLVNGEVRTALVEGLFDAESKMKSLLAASASEFNEKLNRMTVGDIKELARVKAGAGDYCKKLETAAFHCICKETVNEVLRTISAWGGVIERGYNPRPTSLNYEDDPRVVRRKLTNTYVNDYQLISKKGQVKEQRKLLKGKIKKIGGKDELLKIDAFISRKISLTPLSLLGIGNQERFFYRFVKFEKLKGVETAVIECFPKDTSDLKSVFGKLWVDLSDFSIMRISVEPISIGGYSDLLERSRFYARIANTKLILTCDIDYLKKRGGIRFPTRIVIREIYGGGTELKNLTGTFYWERSKTTYSFDDYQFFDVAATSREEEAKK